jgi:hypothetical protein
VRRARRLERAFHAIVASVLGAPPLAAAVSCHGAPSAITSALDATVPEAAADGALDSDGAGDDVGDGGSAFDATSEAGEDAAACSAVPLDAAAYEDAPDGCVAYKLLPCGLPATAQRDKCFVDLATCVGFCHANFIYCQLGPTSCDDAGDILDAASVIECISCNGIAGRRPRGLLPARVARRTPVGDYFVAMAHLEAASVRAFRELAGWLEGFGAPRALVSAALSSAADERRHARATARLARRFGGVPVRARVAPSARPTLVELLEDDAIEGCVKETFAALVATWQAARSTDPRVRRTMRRIAADETRHAALAWEVLDWGLALLSPSDERRVERALKKALSALESGAERNEHGATDSALSRVAGYPTRDEERRLAGGLAELVRHASFHASAS